MTGDATVVSLVSETRSRETVYSHAFLLVPQEYIYPTLPMAEK